MESIAVITALAALAQETRLAAFRRLVEAGPEGVPAGRLAEELGVPAPTLSFHLNQLSQAGLVVARRASRFIYYAADYERMRSLLAYLTENCCGGSCAPPAGDVEVCCSPTLSIGAPTAPTGAKS